MTILGTFLQVVFSIILTLTPAYFLKRDGFKITIGLCFVALMAAFMVGGMIAAIPICILLSAFFYWLRFISNGYPFLFRATFVLVGIWLLLQIVHFPIRVYLDQPQVKKVSNVAGIFVGVCMVNGCVEIIQKIKTVAKDITEPTSPAPTDS